MKSDSNVSFGLTGNQLKIIAMITMTCDHVGLQLLPQWTFLRILGRLALPIYAWMIAEGCRHTRSRKRYLMRLASMAALCQIVYFFAMGSLYMCILVTFSLSVCLIWALEYGKQQNTLKAALICQSIVALVCYICIILPRQIPGFEVDYGIFGVLLPVLIYFGPSKVLFLTLGLILLALSLGGNQWWAFTAVPLLMLYNGRKGTANIGRLFYWYYPAHLAAIYLISLIL